MPDSSTLKPDDSLSHSGTTKHFQSQWGYTDTDAAEKAMRDTRVSPMSPEQSLRYEIDNLKRRLRMFVGYEDQYRDAVARLTGLLATAEAKLAELGKGAA
jgi:hypothetical protein